MLLVAGYWLLVAGYWSLLICSKFSSVIRQLKTVNCKP